MLAQNFKTPADLKVTEAEFDGLVKTLGMIEREEVKHYPLKPGVPPTNDSMKAPTYLKPTGFNMFAVNIATDCGTAGCILGWARELTGRGDLFVDRHMFSPINDLFCMGPGGTLAVGMAEDIQPAQAAAAIRNFLTFGEPRWDEVVQR